MGSLPTGFVKKSVAIAIDFDALGRALRHWVHGLQKSHRAGSAHGWALTARCSWWLHFLQPHISALGKRVKPPHARQGKPGICWLSQ
jgi:hypothetical protein